MHRVLWKFKEGAGEEEPTFGSRHVEIFHLSSILEDLRSWWGLWWVVRLEQKYEGKRKHDAVGSYGKEGL